MKTYAVYFVEKDDTQVVAINFFGLFDSLELAEAEVTMFLVEHDYYDDVKLRFDHPQSFKIGDHKVSIRIKACNMNEPMFK